MKEKYYTAEEAAKRLELNYHTFMMRVRRGVYTFEMLGKRRIFERRVIDRLAANNRQTA